MTVAQFATATFPPGQVSEAIALSEVEIASSQRPLLAMTPG
jgi:hypothetical protein